MLEIDLVLFQALNADAATLPAVVAVARWVSQQLPTAMGGLLLGSLVLGNAAQRRALALALASMALAWLGVQLLRLAVPAPRPAQLGIGVQWVEHAARAGFPSMHVAGAAALAASLALRPVRGLTWLAAAVTAAMVWSRVCLGVHFPSDVLAGGPAHRGAGRSGHSCPGRAGTPLAGSPAAQVATGQRTLTAVRRYRL